MHALFTHEEQLSPVRVILIVTHMTSLATSLFTAITLTTSVKSLLSATDALEMTREGRLSSVEATLLNVIDNCKESVATLSLPDLTFMRGNKSTSLFFGDFYLNSKIEDFIYEDDRHIFLDCVSQLQQTNDAEDNARDNNNNNNNNSGVPDDLDDNEPPPTEPSSCLQQSHAPGEAKEEGAMMVDEESPLLLSPPPSQNSAPSSSSNGASTSIEYRVYGSGDNELRWLESTVLLHKETDNHGVITIMLLTRDVTEKRTEADIIERENAAKLEYITCCAHDLKTPLQSFSSALDLLQASGLSADQRDIWNQAEISLSLMNLTIAQTMDTSKVLMVSR